MAPARKLHLVVDRSPESEPEISGIHSNSALVTTARIPKVQLDRLRAIRDEHEAARMADVERNEWADEAPTVQAAAPEFLAQLPSPIGDEPIANDRIACQSEPPAAPELTLVMRYSAVAPTAPLSVVTIPPFVPVVGAPTLMSPAAFEAIRLTRETARKDERTRTRTKWLVIGIWATAFALAGSLAWIIGHDSTTAPAPIVTE